MTQLLLNSRWSPMDKRIDEIASAERTALRAHWELGNLGKTKTTHMPLYEKLAYELTQNQLVNAIKNLVIDYPEIANSWGCLRRYVS